MLVYDRIVPIATKVFYTDISAIVVDSKGFSKEIPLVAFF
jgi:hypothetical protein